MPSFIKKSQIRQWYPERKPDSHKGQNGRLLIIGGSLDYFGAPILAALGALHGGADLVYLLVPECNFDVTRTYYPDFIVRKYPGNFMNSRTLDSLTDWLPKMDCVLMGPGVGEDPESLRVITRIIQKTNCQLVLDADAIPALAELGLPEPTAKTLISRFTITPNLGEMDEITEGTLPSDFSSQISLVERFAERWRVTILFKSPQTVVISPQKETLINPTGNAGMTVGGSGDVLSGFLASLIAQHISPYEACACAAYLLGAAGDALYRQKGYQFSSTDLALELPYTIRRIVG